MSHGLGSFRAALAWFLFVCSGALFAEERYTHDGFFFRLLLGSGSYSMDFEDPSQASGGSTLKYESSASSIFSAFQVGRAPTKDFIVHLNAFYHGGGSERDLKFKNEGEASLSMFPSGSKTLQEAYTYGFGIGVTYYFPWNIYISPEYRSAVFTRIEHKFEAPSERGLPPRVFQKGRLEGSGFGLTLGKEFWASPQLGIGFVLFYYSDSLNIRKLESRPIAAGDPADEAYERVPTEDLDRGSADQTFAGFALSFTYN